MSLLLPAPAISAALATAILGTDFYSFVRASFPLITGGDVFQSNWHIEAITYELTRVLTGDTRRLLITVPPRSLKSICASVCFPAFALGLDPSRRIICVSYAEGLARKHSNDTRALMRSDMYRAVFPSTRVGQSKDTETEVTTTARGSRLATSVGGTLTGRGGSLIIIDDPLKPQDAQSESARESVTRWYANTLLSRLDQKTEGSIVVVMQRLHPDDLVGHLLEQGGWRHLNLPAIAEEETIIDLGRQRRHVRKVGELLHPERESEKALNELRSSMGSMEFAAQYQQAPVPPEGNMIKWAWFGSYDVAPTPQYGDQLTVSWDTAQSSRELADYSACVVLLRRVDRVYILDVLRERLEYPDLKRAVIKSHAKWRWLGVEFSLLIEKQGSGLSLIQDLRRENIYAIGVQPTADKIVRMAAQTPTIESGAVHLPVRAPWLGEFQKEIMSFPVGKHDDQVDALSQALQRTPRPEPQPVYVTRYQTIR